MNSEQVKKRLLQNPKIKKEWDRYDLAFEVSQKLLELRLFRGLTQEKLAKLLRTKQESIARVESGKNLPSLLFLNKIAKVLRTRLNIGFELVEKVHNHYKYGASYRSENLEFDTTGNKSTFVLPSYSFYSPTVDGACHD